jgi:hypothetical protein
VTGYVEHRVRPLDGHEHTFSCSCGRVFTVEAGWAVCPGDPFGEARKRAATMTAGFAQQRVIDEAETALRGEYPVSVVHGDPESDCDAELMFGRLPRAAGSCARGAGAVMTRTIGGNDYTTFVFTGQGAEAAAAEFARQAAAMGPRWWRVTATLYPDFGR